MSQYFNTKYRGIYMGVGHFYSTMSEVTFAWTLSYNWDKEFHKSDNHSSMIDKFCEICFTVCKKYVPIKKPKRFLQQLNQNTKVQKKPNEKTY